MQYDLSIIIPARNEMFLAGTIEKLIEKKRGKTEIIAVLDSEWSNPPISQHPDVCVIYVPESIGQRKATNLGARLSKARYIMKLDAHCLMEEGFDVKLIDGFKQTGDNVTVTPIMRNLWMYSWKCYHCGWKKYQGPTPEKCDQCGKTDKIRRKMMWVGKERPQSWSYCFDSLPHFQYYEEYKHRQNTKEQRKTGFTETMSLQGSCYMMTREQYSVFAKDREALGSWGNEGLEIACKTWLSGGRVLVNHNTWYAHMFRTQGGDFSFPYPQKGVQGTKKRVKDLFWDGKFEKQIHPVSWLVEKFAPVKGWSDDDLKKLKEHESK